MVMIDLYCPSGNALKVVSTERHADQISNAICRDFAFGYWWHSVSPNKRLNQWLSLTHPQAPVYQT